MKNTNWLFNLTAVLKQNLLFQGRH